MCTRTDNLDSFFNATVDGTVVMQSFILSAEASGLACVPVSYIRNHAARLAQLLELPEGVFSDRRHRAWLSHLGRQSFDAIAARSNGAPRPLR